MLAPDINNSLAQESHDTVQKRQIEVSFCTSLKYLVGKDILNNIRNPMVLKMRLVSTIFLAIYTSGLYFQFDGEYIGRDNWRALTGFLFFLSISTMMLTLNPTDSSNE